MATVQVPERYRQQYSAANPDYQTPSYTPPTVTRQQMKENPNENYVNYNGRQVREADLDYNTRMKIRKTVNPIEQYKMGMTPTFDNIAYNVKGKPKKILQTLYSKFLETGDVKYVNSIINIHSRESARKGFEAREKFIGMGIKHTSFTGAYGGGTPYKIEKKENKQDGIIFTHGMEKLRKEKNPVQSNVSQSEYVFSGGMQIKRGDERIRTDSEEGKKIEKQFWYQQRAREINAQQKNLFWAVTKSANANEAYKVRAERISGNPNVGTFQQIYNQGRLIYSEGTSGIGDKSVMIQGQELGKAQEGYAGYSKGSIASKQSVNLYDKNGNIVARDVKQTGKENGDFILNQQAKYEVTVDGKTRVFTSKDSADKFINQQDTTTTDLRHTAFNDIRPTWTVANQDPKTSKETPTLNFRNEKDAQDYINKNQKETEFVGFAGNLVNSFGEKPLSTFGEQAEKVMNWLGTEQEKRAKENPAKAYKSVGGVKKRLQPLDPIGMGLEVAKDIVSGASAIDNFATQNIAPAYQAIAPNNKKPVQESSFVLPLGLGTQTYKTTTPITKEILIPETATGIMFSGAIEMKKPSEIRQSLTAYEKKYGRGTVVAGVSGMLIPVPLGKIPKFNLLAKAGKVGERLGKVAIKVPVIQKEIVKTGNVFFHGTSTESVKSILKSGFYKTEQETSFGKYKGVFVTPEKRVAEIYATRSGKLAGGKLAGSRLDIVTGERMKTTTIGEMAKKMKIEGLPTRTERTAILKEAKKQGYDIIRERVSNYHIIINQKKILEIRNAGGIKKAPVKTAYTIKSKTVTLGEIATKASETARVSQMKNFVAKAKEKIELNKNMRDIKKIEKKQAESGINYNIERIGKSHAVVTYGMEEARYSLPAETKEKLLGFSKSGTAQYSKTPKTIQIPKSAVPKRTTPMARVYKFGATIKGGIEQPDYNFVPDEKLLPKMAKKNRLTDLFKKENIPTTKKQVVQAGKNIQQTPRYVYNSFITTGKKISSEAKRIDSNLQANYQKYVLDTGQKLDELSGADIKNAFRKALTPVRREKSKKGIMVEDIFVNAKRRGNTNELVMISADKSDTTANFYKMSETGKNTYSKFNPSNETMDAFAKAEKSGVIATVAVGKKIEFDMLKKSFAEPSIFSKIRTGMAKPKNTARARETGQGITVENKNLPIREKISQKITSMKQGSYSLKKQFAFEKRIESAQEYKNNLTKEFNSGKIPKGEYDELIRKSNLQENKANVDYNNYLKRHGFNYNKQLKLIGTKTKKVSTRIDKPVRSIFARPPKKTIFDFVGKKSQDVVYVETREGGLGRSTGYIEQTQSRFRNDFVSYKNVGTEANPIFKKFSSPVKRLAGKNPSKYIGYGSKDFEKKISKGELPPTKVINDTLRKHGFAEMTEDEIKARQNINPKRNYDWSKTTPMRFDKETGTPKVTGKNILKNEEVLQKILPFYAEKGIRNRTSRNAYTVQPIAVQTKSDTTDYLSTKSTYAPSESYKSNIQMGGFSPIEMETIRYPPLKEITRISTKGLQRSETVQRNLQAQKTKQLINYDTVTRQQTKQKTDALLKSALVTVQPLKTKEVEIFKPVEILVPREIIKIKERQTVVPIITQKQPLPEKQILKQPLPDPTPRITKPPPVFAFPILNSRKKYAKKKQKGEYAADFLGAANEGSVFGLSNRDDVTYGIKKIAKLSALERKKIKHTPAMNNPINYKITKKRKKEETDTFSEKYRGSLKKTKTSLFGNKKLDLNVF